MGYAYASGVISAPVEQVWTLVRRFDGLPAWHPYVTSCEMVDDAHPMAVGSRRVQGLANGGTALAQLVSLDDAKRALVYEMLEGPWPVRNYVATVQLTPITESGTTFVEWWGRFDADQAVTDAVETDFRDGTYEAGVRALQEWFASPERVNGAAVGGTA